MQFFVEPRPFSHPVASLDPHEDPNPALTKVRKIALGKKLLYAAQLGGCESQPGSAAADGTDSSGGGAIALDAMGKIDTLDGLLKEASESQVAYPEGRIFEDRDRADKVRALPSPPQTARNLNPRPFCSSFGSTVRRS